MAGKRNSIGKVQAPSLKEAVDKLIGELGVEQIPPGWFSLQDLIKQTGLPEKRIQRKLAETKVPQRKFRIMVCGCIRSLIHYQISK